MASSERVFTHPSQLNGLTVTPFLRTSGLGRFRLGGTITKHRESKRWERELNRYYYACGCDTGAKCLIIGLLAAIVWAGYCYYQGTWDIGLVVGITILIPIGGALAGKGFGLYRANQKLKETIREIQEQWHPDETPESERRICG